MRKYIMLCSLFLLLSVIGYANNLYGTVFTSALVAGYFLSKIQYKYTKRSRFRSDSFTLYDSRR